MKKFLKVLLVLGGLAALGYKEMPAMKRELKIMGM